MKKEKFREVIDKYQSLINGIGIFNLKLSNKRNYRIILETLFQNNANKHDFIEIYSTPFYGVELFLNLKEPNAANINWLKIALKAFEYSYTHNGIMSKYYDCKNYDIWQEYNFYECLCRAIAAFARHKYTNYDDIKKDDDNYDIIKEQKTKDGMKYVLR